MATAPATIRNAPSVVLRKLRQLRRKLTGWILVHGMGRWLMLVLVVLAGDMLLDRVFKMDFAQRLIMLAVMTAVMIIYFGWRVIRPLLKRPNDDTLIYEVENKHPDLKENLISSWQLARQQDLESIGVSAELADVTIQRGIAQAEKIDFGKALDLAHHRQNWMILLCGLTLTVLLAIGITKNDFLNTWFSRNVLLSNNQWPQGTYLEIVGVENGKLVLPRGADHRQLVLITEDSSVNDVMVSIEVDNPGARTIHPMKPTGKLDGREQSHLFHNVSSTFRFRALGGDDVTDWVEIELVEPPAVIELELLALLPAYTGVSSLVLTGGGPHSVLSGSSLQINARVNKSLQKVSLKRDSEIHLMESTSAPDLYSLTLSPDDLRGGEYQFELIDESGLANIRPSKFAITLKEDLPPKGRANLLGISGLVVPRAMLPVSYQFSDSYGLRRLFFDCHWKTGMDGDQKPFDRELPIAEYSRTETPVRESKNVEVLDLLPLKLEPGISFRFSVSADDTRPETPNTGKTQEFLLRVVTDEELRADLLRREIEQRKSFEQAYEVQMELATEILALAARLPDPGLTPEQFRIQRESELIDLVRDQKSVGTSIARVADRFEEFLVEVKNNRLDEAENELAPNQKIEARFEAGIIQPIRYLDQELISLATRNLDNCRRSANNEEGLAQAANQTSLVHQQVLAEMKKILDAMNDSENFQEIINDLLEVKTSAQGVKDGIKDKLNPKNIFDDQGIFDN